jgi:Phytanoyl-CoA dioxygenase (PhyH)
MNPAQIVLSPYYFCQLFTGAKSFEGNPIIGADRLNARGLHALRVKWAYRLAAARRRRLASLVPVADREAFERDGFVIRRNFLSETEFTALLSEVKACRCEAQEIKQGATTNRKFAVTGKTLRQIPTLAKVIRSPDWRGLINYVGSRAAAPLVYLQTIVRSSAGAADPQTFLHADTFHPTVKAWLFLTDVPENAGPFTYVAGSHRLTPERLAWEQRTSIGAGRSPNKETREGSFRIEADELESLGLPQPRQLAVPANTLVVADTFGFHARGPSTGASLRVEIWAIGPRHPFTPWTGFGLWTTETLGWATTFVGKLAGGRKQRRVNMSAFDVGPAA